MLFRSTLWMKAQHEGTLTSPCIVWKNPPIPLTAPKILEISYVWRVVRVFYSVNEMNFGKPQEVVGGVELTRGIKQDQKVRTVSPTPSPRPQGRKEGLEIEFSKHRPMI